MTEQADKKFIKPVKSEINNRENEPDQTAWKNLLLEYGSTVISRAEYEKTKVIPAAAAGHYLVSEAWACDHDNKTTQQRCNRIIKVKLEPFTRSGVLADCLRSGKCQEHDNAADQE